MSATTVLEVTSTPIERVQADGVDLAVLTSPSVDDLAFVEMLWRDWSPGHDPTDDLPAVKEALREPANLGAALGYYRATLGDGFVDPELAAIQEATQMLPPQPTLYLHGAQDGCVGVEVAEAAAAALDERSAFRIVAGAGHFLHLEDPATVDAEIVEFLS